MFRPLSIILLSYKDERVLSAIKSIRRFDDSDAVSIVVIDGGSGQELVDRIRNHLESDDILLSERDGGIFDALNKGLELSTGAYIGWLGSDDIFTDEIKSSEVIAKLGICEIFVGSTIHAFGTRVLRRTTAWSAGSGLVKWGLNNPHFSTFGRKAVFTTARFDLHHPAADIVYFLKIFSACPKVCTDHRTFTVMQAYGASNRSLSKIIANNISLISVYRDTTNLALALIGLAVKGLFKCLNIVYYKLNRTYVCDPLLSQNAI